MLVLAFTLGLFGSLHCVGMCGPIALLIPLQRQRKGFRSLQLGAYFIGKTLAYALMGLLFGFVGEGIFSTEKCLRKATFKKNRHKLALYWFSQWVSTLWTCLYCPIWSAGYGQLVGKYDLYDRLWSGYHSLDALTHPLR